MSDETITVKLLPPVRRHIDIIRKGGMEPTPLSDAEVLTLSAETIADLFAAVIDPDIGKRTRAISTLIELGLISGHDRPALN